MGKTSRQWAVDVRIHIEKTRCILSQSAWFNLSFCPLEALVLLHPLNLNIIIQILLTGLHTFF